MRFFFIVAVCLFWWTVFGSISIWVNYLITKKEVYACSEVTKKDPIDVIQMCKRRGAWRS